MEVDYITRVIAAEDNITETINALEDLVRISDDDTAAVITACIEGASAYLNCLLRESSGN